MKNMKAASIAVLLSVAAGLLVAFFATRAEALGAPLGGIRTFQVTCATTATRIAETPNSGMSAFMAFNSSATAAFIGGSDVNATTAGMPVCTAATCVGSSMSVDGGGAFCMSVGGAVVLTVTSGK